MKIIIFGASGAGTTTLGRTLAEKLGWKHLDADDYYWEPTDPPFQYKIPLEERNRRLWRDLQAHQSVIISGSLVTWGSHWVDAWPVFPIDFRHFQKSQPAFALSAKPFVTPSESTCHHR